MGNLAKFLGGCRNGKVGGGSELGLTTVGPNGATNAFAVAIRKQKKTINLITWSVWSDYSCSKRVVCGDDMPLC